MAGEASFSPDLLLVVGADLTQLRAQLAQIQREIGASTNVQGSGTREIVRGLNDVTSAAKEARENVSKLSDELKRQMAEARTINNFNKAEIRAERDERTRLNKEIQESLDARRRLEEQIARQINSFRKAEIQGDREAAALKKKELDDSFAARRKVEEQIAGLINRYNKDEVQALRQNESLKRKIAQDSADAVRYTEEQKARLINSFRKAEISAYQDEARRNKEAEESKRREADKTASYQQTRDKETYDARARLEQNLARQRGLLEGQASRLERVGQRAAGAPVPLAIREDLQGQVRAAQAEVAAARAQVGRGISLTPVELQNLKNTINATTNEVRNLTSATGAAETVFGSFFSRIGRYTQIALGLSLVYGAMRAVFAGAQEFIEVDKQLAKIAATMNLNADRATVLRDSYSLMFEANQKLGISFSDSGKVIFELQKSLENNAESIQAAFLPALTLVSLGEGNQTEILRTLIGTYKLFGETLGNTTPQEKYLRISDALIASSAASIQDIEGFRVALQNVAPVAQQAGVSLEATLASLVILTNGMQSASRAGTGLRQLLVDLQTRPALISKIFDIPFDPDKPLNATKLLDGVIRKIREVGTESVKSQAMINAAFPDKRATLALETLIALYPQYNQALKDVEGSAGRTAAAQRELSNTIDAALGRFSGTVFAAVNKNLEALFNFKPGDAKPVVGVLDSISGLIQTISDRAAEAIIRIQQLLALRSAALGEGSKSDRNTFFGVPLESIPGSAEYKGQPLLYDLRPAFQALMKRIGEQLPPEVLKELQRLERQLPASKLEQVAQDAEFKSRLAGLAEQQPDDTKQNAALKARALLTDELKTRRAEFIRQAELEFTVNDRQLSFAKRIAAADALVIERTKEKKRAEDDFLSTAGLTNRELADVQQIEGTYKAKIEAERRAMDKAKELRRQDAEEAVDLAKAQATQVIQNARQVEAVFSKFVAFRAQIKDTSPLDKQLEQFRKLADELNDAQFQPLTPEEFSQLNVMFRDLGQLLFEYWVDPLLEITKLDYESGWVKFNVGLNKNIDDAKKLRGIVSNITGEAAPSPEVVEQRQLEREIGLDKAREELQRLRNEVGFTREEVIANFAAMKAGAKDFADLLSQINSGTLTPDQQRRKEIVAFRVIPALQNTENLSVSERIKKDTQDENKNLQGLRDGYGKAGAELEKYIIARARWEKSFDELTPAQQKEIELLVQTREAMRNAAVASGLVALGFSKANAEILASQAAQLAANQGNIQAALNELERFNNASEVARQQQEQFIQISSKATGNFVAFFISKMREAANEGTDFWTLLGNLAEETSKAMSDALADFFFATFKGETKSAKEAWDNFLNSMLRSISNFLAQAAVRSFMNLLFGTGSGNTGINVNVTDTLGFGGGGGGGGTGSAIGGLATSVLQNFLGGTSSPTGGGGGGGFNTQGLIQTGASQAVSGVTGGPGLVSGVLNASSNFAMGGVTGVAFGVPTVVAGGTTFVVPAGTSGYALAELGAIGVDASVGAGTSGLFAAGGTAASAISASTVVLAALVAAYETYKGIVALEENKQGTKGYNAGLGGLSGVAAGAIIGTIIYPGVGTIIGAALGGTIGSLAGGFFGADPEDLEGYRIRAEQARAFYSANASLKGIGDARSPTELQRYLISLQSGYVGGQQGAGDNAIAIGFRNLQFTPDEFLAALNSRLINLPTGYVNPLNAQQVTDAVRAGIQGLSLTSSGNIAATIGIGNQNPYYTTLTGPGFAQFYNQAGVMGGPQEQAEVYALIQQGLSREALAEADTAVLQAIKFKFDALKDVNFQLNRALNEVLKQTITPATRELGDQAIQQAKQFRQTVNGLIVANAIEIASLADKLRIEEDPIKVIEYVDTIRGLIEARYNDEITLVNQFADALDQLASGFKKASQSIQDQIDVLNASNLGPTNPLEAFRKAQTRFGEAREEFFREPTPENAARVQQLVEPLLQAAGQVFTRPSMQYQDIFQNTINTLQEIKQKADSEAADITAALSSALGTANSIADLTQKNTKQMAEDMKVLRHIAELRLTELGFTITPSTESTTGIPSGTQQQLVSLEWLRQNYPQLFSTPTPPPPPSTSPIGTEPLPYLSGQTYNGVPIEVLYANAQAQQMAAQATQGTWVDSQTEGTGPTWVGASLLGPGQYFNTDSEGRAYGEVQYDPELAAEFYRFLASQGMSGAVFAQSGARYTNEGLYYLHEGERVLPRAMAEASRRGEFGGMVANLTISPGAIIINGATDPNATGRAVVEVVETSIRTGRLGRVISERVKARP